MTEDRTGPTPRAHDVVASIINYRTPEMTIRAAEAALADAGALDVHVVVIDNRSDDGSVEKLEAWIAGLGPDAPVSLVRSATNAGFAGGHNQGFAARPARAYMVLNSDAFLRPGAMAALWAALQADPTVGVVTPRLVGEDDAPQISCFRFDSPIGEFLRGAQLGPVNRLLRRWDKLLPLDPEPGQIDWVAFACVLIPAAMIAQIGPMDDGYFMYFEDGDYCLKARRAGWRVVYEPRAQVTHLVGGSGDVQSAFARRNPMPAYYYAARSRFLYRGYGHAGLLAANMLYTLGRTLNLARYLVGDPPRRIPGELRDIWINALTPLGDRRAPPNAR